MSVIGQLPTGSRIPIGTIDNGWSQWGGSSITVAPITSSSPNDSFGSIDSFSSSSSSSSSSPVPQSPDWGQSERASGFSPTRSPRQTTRKTSTISSKGDAYQQQQKLQQEQQLQRGYRSSSKQSRDDHPEELTTTTTSSKPQKQLSTPRQSFSSCPELCTISEDETFSSDTLSQLSIRSTSEEISKCPVLAKPPPTEQQLLQENLERRKRNAKYRDPYNDPYDDDDDLDCVDCWSHHKSRFQIFWPFGKLSEKQKFVTKSETEKNGRKHNNIALSKPRAYVRQSTV